MDGVICRVLNIARVALTDPSGGTTKFEGNPEENYGSVRFADCAASVPPPGTEQVSAGRQDRLVARELGKCLMPRFSLPSGDDHCSFFAALT
jgi:hypothetical protein